MPIGMRDGKKAFALPVPGKLSYALSVLLAVLLCLGHWESRPPPQIAPSASIAALHKTDAAALLRFVDRSNGVELQTHRPVPAKFTGSGAGLLRPQKNPLILADGRCDIADVSRPAPARRICHSSRPRAPPFA